MKYLINIILASLIAIFSGCSSTKPILNVENETFNSEKRLTLPELESGIISAGASLGWSMTKIRDGEIKGEITLRKHSATILIPYNTKEYSIRYIQSDNLNYNASNNTIHAGYNGWINNLSGAINRIYDVENLTLAKSNKTLKVKQTTKVQPVHHYIILR